MRASLARLSDALLRGRARRAAWRALDDIAAWESVRDRPPPERAEEIRQEVERLQRSIRLVSLPDLIVVGGQLLPWRLTYDTPGEPLR